MTITASVSVSYPGKFQVKVKNGQINGRGIKEVSTSIPDTKKYIVTEKAYEKIQAQYQVKFENVLN